LSRNILRYPDEWMRPLIRTVLGRCYRLVSAPPLPEDDVEIAPGITIPRYAVTDAEAKRAESEKFLDRLPCELDVRGKSVLEVGCGAGELCMELARRGATRVLGVELADVVKLAQSRLAGETGLAVEFRAYGGDLHELGDEHFDVIVSKDSFEHYGAIPGSPSAEQMTHDMGERLVEGGLLVIGFGPLWKAPFGGHLDARRMPWAHLVFPEEVIFDEFRRVRPPGNTSRTFEEGPLVNRMTLKRFRRITGSSGLELVGMETNVTEHPFAGVMRTLARLSAFEEYCTQNVYGVWRRPLGWT